MTPFNTTLTLWFAKPLLVTSCWFCSLFPATKLHLLTYLHTFCLCILRNYWHTFTDGRGTEQDFKDKDLILQAWREKKSQKHRVGRKTPKTRPGWMKVWFWSVSSNLNNSMTLWKELAHSNIEKQEEMWECKHLQKFDVTKMSWFYLIIFFLSQEQWPLNF